MCSRVRYLLVCAFMILLCPLLSAAADLESAKRAYEDKDYAKALQEATPLVEQGNAEAQCLLGKMYWMGEGVLKDPERAIKLFKASGSQGNADAQFYVGSYYLLPLRDVLEGAKWLRVSAEQGSRDAQWLLGKAYLEGAKDLPRDPVQAYMWLRLAAKDNLEFYVNAYRAAEKQMNAAQIAKATALADAWKPKPGLKPEEKP